MWSALRPELHLFVGRDRVIAASRDLSLRQQALKPECASIAVDDRWRTVVSPALRDISDHAQRRKIRVWLSSYWARTLVAPPVQGVESDQERHDALSALSSEIVGLQTPCEVVRPSGLHARSLESVPMVAAPTFVRAGLHSWCLECSSRLVGLHPSWAMVTSRAEYTAGRGVCVEDGDGVTLLVQRDAASWSAMTWVVEVPQADMVRNLVRRTCSAHQLNTSEVPIVSWPHAAESEEDRAIHVSAGLIGSFVQWDDL